MSRRFIAVLAISFLAPPVLTQAPIVSGQARLMPPVKALDQETNPQLATQPTTALEATQDADIAKEAAISHLMKLIDSAEMGEQVMAPMMQQIRRVIATVVPEKDRQKFMDDFSDKFRRRFSGDRIANAIVPVYARHFSLEDIQALTQFYESPVGQRFVAALPQVSRESQAVGAQMGQEAVLATLREMSDEYPDLTKLLEPGNVQPKGTPGPSTVDPKPASATPSR